MERGAQTDLRRLANEHWRDTYRLLVSLVGGEWREFGSVDAFATPHLDRTFVNGCVVLTPADPGDLRAAIEWLSRKSTSYLIRIDLGVATPELLAVPTAMGLAGDETSRMPAMVLPLIPAAPPLPNDITVCRVDEQLARELTRDLVAIESPHRAFLETFAAPSLETGPLALFAAYLDGRFAATSAVVRTGTTCGIYAVGTAEWARRRGVGTAVTWAALEHARSEWGSSVAVLQSSPSGVSVYEKMGFRHAAEYQLFFPRDDAQVTQ